jgi:hypothetical protein
LVVALVSALRGPERPLDRRTVVIKRFSYSELAACYLAEARILTISKA